MPICRFQSHEHASEAFNLAAMLAEQPSAPVVTPPPTSRVARGPPPSAAKAKPRARLPASTAQSSILLAVC